MYTSFIIITQKRNHLLEQCLKSLVTQTNSSDQIIVVYNGQDSHGEKLKQLFPMIETYQINETTPAAARNYAINLVHHDWICFLDDDTLIPENYISKASKIINLHQPDVFGGPDKAPPQSTDFEMALSMALKSPLTTAHTRHRHTTSEGIMLGAESNLILCHLWVKTKILRDTKFNPVLKRNEENYLLDILEKEGHSILYIADLWIYHFRKKDLFSLYKAVSTSGYFRAKTFSDSPKVKQLIYFAPLLFNLYLLSLPFLSYSLFFVPLYLYIVLNFITSLVEINDENKTKLLIRTSLIQFLIIVFYGIGFLNGLLSVSLQLFSGRGFRLDRV